MKVVILGAIGVLAATALTGVLMVWRLQDSFEAEVENRARVLLAAVSVPCGSALASNRVEELDFLISEFRARMADSADVAEVAVLDNRLRVVGHTDPAMYGRLLDDAFSVESGTAAGAVIRVQGEGESREMLASMPLATSVGGLPGIRWGTLTARLRLSKVDEELRRVLLDNVALMVVLATLSGLLLFVLSERLVLKPIAKLNEKLEGLVRTDALTGLWNRRHLTENLGLHFALARRGNRKLAFAMLDVDHFKTYNDTYGHPAGDEVLKSLAEILRERVRQTDIACRYGGEEFAILFPDTGSASAYKVCEELRQKMQGAVFPGAKEGDEVQVTASVGVAELSGEMSDPSELVRLADKALYAAKQAGRNRTHVGVTEP